MSNQVISLLQTALRSCVNWAASLFDATGMGGIITAVFILGLIVSFFLMPLRGVSINAGHGFSEFAGTSIHKFKSSRKAKRTQKGK